MYVEWKGNATRYTGVGRRCNRNGDTIGKGAIGNAVIKRNDAIGNGRTQSRWRCNSEWRNREGTQSGTQWMQLRRSSRAHGAIGNTVDAIETERRTQSKKSEYKCNTI